MQQNHPDSARITRSALLSLPLAEAGCHLLCLGMWVEEFGQLQDFNKVHHHQTAWTKEW